MMPTNKKTLEPALLEFQDSVFNQILSDEHVYVFAPLSVGEQVKQFTASEAPCTGLQLGINEGGKTGLMCFYFVEIEGHGAQAKSNVALLSLVNTRNQLELLLNPYTLAQLLNVTPEMAQRLLLDLARDYQSYLRIRMIAAFMGGNE